MVLAFHGETTPVQVASWLPFLAGSPTGKGTANSGWNKVCMRGKRGNVGQTKKKKAAFNLFKYLKVADKKKRHCSHDGSDKKCRKAIALEVRSKVMQLGGQGCPTVRPAGGKRGRKESPTAPTTVPEPATGCLGPWQPQVAFATLLPHLLLVSGAASR